LRGSAIIRNLYFESYCQDQNELIAQRFRTPISDHGTC